MVVETVSEAAPVQPTPAPVPAPAPAPARFANFQAIPAAPARAVPARQQQRIRVPAQRPRQQQQQQQQRPRIFAPQQPAAPAVGNTDPHFAGLRFQFQIQAPEFNYQNNFAENAYAFSSPFYSTNAQGGTYSYAAIY